MVISFIVLIDLVTEKIDQVSHHFVVKYPLSFLNHNHYEHSRYYSANAQTHCTAKTT